MATESKSIDMTIKLEKMTIKKLRQLCRDNKYTGFSQKNKRDLILFIKNKQQENQTEVPEVKQEPEVPEVKQEPEVPEVKEEPPKITFFNKLDDCNELGSMATESKSIDTTIRMSKKIWIFRVDDGENFRNSKFPFWGVKRGRGGACKTIVKKIRHGDILCFLTRKKYGGKIIGMSEYCGFYDRNDEPLIQINTKTNEEQNWKGDEKWDIQIHYCNLYITEKQNIRGCIKCGGNILEYETFRDEINRDLYDEYNNFKFYAEPKIFN